MSATPSLTSVRQAIDELDDLSDTQTIRLLERHRRIAKARARPTSTRPSASSSPKTRSR
jgi:hypothetical protein